MSLHMPRPQRRPRARAEVRDEFDRCNEVHLTASGERFRRLPVRLERSQRYQRSRSSQSSGSAGMLLSRRMSSSGSSTVITCPCETIRALQRTFGPDPQARVRRPHPSARNRLSRLSTDGCARSRSPSLGALFVRPTPSGKRSRPRPVPSSASLWLECGSCAGRQRIHRPVRPLLRPRGVRDHQRRAPIRSLDRLRVAVPRGL